MPKWDYVCVNLVRSYGLNYRRNGVKMADWKDKPLFEVMQTLGGEGYEFSAFDGQNYIFKKPMGVPDQAQAVQPIQRPTQPVQTLQRPTQPQPGQAPQGQPRPAPGAQSTTSTGLRSLKPVAPQDDDS